MSHPNDDHNQALVLDRIQDPIVADPGSPDIIGAAKLDSAAAPRVGREPIDASRYPALNPTIQLRKLPRGRCEELDRVHEPKPLQAELRLELVPAQSFAVGRIRQRRSHVVKIAGVLERLDQLEVLDRHHRGHTTAVPREHHALTTEGDAVDRRREGLSRLADPSL